MVDRRFVRAKACLKEYVNLMKMKILVVVRSKQSETLCHRKGKGSLTMSISQGLVDPNCAHNLSYKKGKQVNIPVLSWYTWQHKFVF